MNIRGGSKDRIDIKMRRLNEELRKRPEDQNPEVIRRLKESIQRNKNISKIMSRKHRRGKK